MLKEGFFEDVTLNKTWKMRISQSHEELKEHSKQRYFAASAKALHQKQPSVLQRQEGGSVTGMQ